MVSLWRRFFGAIDRRDVYKLGVAVWVVSLASVFVLVGTAQPASVHTTRRVVAKDTKVLAQRVVPPAQPRVVRHYSSYATSDCPALNNPGGLRWQPSANAGPTPVNGVVKIPRFGVNAPIFKVGVGLDGMMVLPHNARDVAWLDQGPYPGDTQNVVLAGHIAYSHITGSFGHIQSLRPGDTVVVEMDGKDWVYQIRWSCLFDRDTDLAAKVMGYTDVQSLTLISCGGVWDAAAHTHNKRVAVRAELVSSG